jgi:hypothetical protein
MSTITPPGAHEPQAQTTAIHPPLSTKQEEARRASAAADFGVAIGLDRPRPELGRAAGMTVTKGFPAYGDRYGGDPLANRSKTPAVSLSRASFTAASHSRSCPRHSDAPRVGASTGPVRSILVIASAEAHADFGRRTEWPPALRLRYPDWLFGVGQIVRESPGLVCAISTSR